MHCTMYDFHNSTDNLTFWTEKWAIKKTFLFFIQFWWKKVLLIARFSVHNLKLSVELWKSYIVIVISAYSFEKTVWK